MLIWHYISQNTYNNLSDSEKTSDKLFFINDTKKIYCGKNPFNESIILYNSTTPNTNLLNRLYINGSTLEGKIWDSSKWIDIIAPIRSNISTQYLESSEIKSISYDSLNNNLKVIFVDDTEDTVDFSNILLDLLYDAPSNEFIIEYESVSLTNIKKNIYISEFISSISYSNNIITISFNNTNKLDIGIEDIVYSSTDNIIAITITGNTFIAESLLSSNKNNKMVYSNNLYTVYNSTKANYSPVSTFSLEDPTSSNVVSSEDSMVMAIDDITSTLQTYSSGGTFNVGEGHEGELIIIDASGFAAPSGIKLGGSTMKDPPSGAFVASEAGVSKFVTNNTISASIISKADKLADSSEEASNEKLVSEKAFVNAVSWHIL